MAHAPLTINASSILPATDSPRVGVIGFPAIFEGEISPL
jgi:hypothetical protein